MTILSACFFILGIVQGLQATYRNERLVTRLRQILDPDVMPYPAVMKPVEVSLSLSLINIAEVDVIKNEVVLDVWQTISWKDAGLAWKPSEYANMTSLSLPSKYLWIPDITVYNGVTRTETSSPGLVIVANDGRLTQIPIKRIRILCDVSALHSLGVTTCTIKLGSWTYDGSRITLTKPEKESMDISSYFHGSSFEVLETNAVRNVARYSCCPALFEDITFSFSFIYKENYYKDGY